MPCKFIGMSFGCGRVTALMVIPAGKFAKFVGQGGANAA